jgi:DNA-binding CsgD family transcriptional regulator
MWGQKMGIQDKPKKNIEFLQFDIRHVVKQISKSTNLEAACLVAEQYFLSKRHQLISVVFCDTENIENIIRPFRNMPEALANIGIKLRGNGGCPIAREAIKLLHPFDTIEIDRSQNDDFLSNRFLDEMSKLPYDSIFVVPVILGRGLALFTVGSMDGELDADGKIVIIDAVCQISVAVITRFPKATTFFESKRLSTLESEALFLNSNGYSDLEIGKFLDLSEFAIGLTIKSAAKKLKAKNRSQMIANALAFGEISNMQFRDQV